MKKLLQAAKHQKAISYIKEKFLCNQTTFSCSTTRATGHEINEISCL